MSPESKRRPVRAFAASISARTALALAMVVVTALPAFAVPSAPASRYASIVVEAETGNVLYERNADLPRYPASLTKMMTLYLTFEALASKKLSLSDNLSISTHAATRDPSRLDLAPGAKLKVEDAIRAITTKSANDAACALAETLAKGSEAKFAEMMTAKGKALGLQHTTFRNASGLPEDGHMTTARDLATLGRCLVRDYPDYYRYFSTNSFDWKGMRYPNQNRFLHTYYGADGIKTGFVNASGHNLAASAVRGGKRLIAIVLGGDTQQWTREHASRLLDVSYAKIDPSLVMVASNAGASPTDAAAASMADATQPMAIPAATAAAADARPASAAAPPASAAPASAPAATAAAGAATAGAGAATAAAGATTASAAARPSAAGAASASASVRHEETYATPGGAVTIASAPSPASLPMPDATANLAAYAAAASAPKAPAGGVGGIPTALSPAAAVATPPSAVSAAAPTARPANAAAASAKLAAGAVEASRTAVLAKPEPVMVASLPHAPSQPSAPTAAEDRALAPAARNAPSPLPATPASGAAKAAPAAAKAPPVVVASVAQDPEPGHPGGGEWSVQVGLFRDATIARRRGEEARNQMPLALRSADLIVGRAQDGVHVTSRIGRLSEQDARAACSQLQRGRVPCVVVPPGRPLIVATN